MYQKSRFHSIRPRARRQSESGQLVIEYVLLLVVSLGIAILMTNMMVSRADPEGFVISALKSILTAIASDRADDIQ